MRDWTIQNEDAWQVLCETGKLRATTDHQSDWWPEAYGWMRNQLVERIGQPSSDDTAPLWGWVRWGPGSARPDLRTLRWNWHPVGSYLLLECDLPERTLLHSDFMVWHSLLNGSFVPYSEKDEEDADRFRGPIRRKHGIGSVYEKAPQSIRNTIRKSWERIFDFDALRPDYGANCRALDPNVFLGALTRSSGFTQIISIANAQAVDCQVTAMSALEAAALLPAAV